MQVRAFLCSFLFFLLKRLCSAFVAQLTYQLTDLDSLHAVFTIRGESSLHSYVTDLYIGERISNRHSKTRKKMAAVSERKCVTFRNENV